ADHVVGEPGPVERFECRRVGVHRAERTHPRASFGYAPATTDRGGTIAMPLLDDVDALIARRSLLDHPFYTKWVAGTLPKEAIREYTRQYFAFESSFPRFLSAIHSGTEDPAARQSVLENLWDEE